MATLPASRSTGALRGLATPEKYSNTAFSTGYTGSAALLSPSKFTPMPASAGDVAPGSLAAGALAAPSAGALTELLSSPWGGAAGGALAATKELLGSCAAPAEQARLLQQVHELRTECTRLAAEQQAEDERFEASKADLAECQGLCATAAAHVGGLERQLGEAKAALADAQHAGGELERSTEETRAQLALAARVEAEQRQRLRGALLAVDQAAAGVAAEKERAANLAERMRSTEPLLKAAFKKQAGSASAVAALGLQVVEARHRAQDAQKGERTAHAVAAQATSELQQAKDELDALGAELAGAESRRLSCESATKLHAGLAKERFNTATAELSMARAEALGASATSMELLSVNRDLEAQRALIARCLEAEALAGEAARQERALELQEREAAASRVRKLQLLAERSAGEAKAWEGERKSMEAATEVAHAELKDEIAHAHAAVSSASKSLEAIRVQLRDLHVLGEQLRSAGLATATATATMKEKAAARQSEHGRVEKRLSAALAELEVVQRHTTASVADGAECVASSERQCRHAAEELKRLGLEQAMKAEASKAEEEQRSAIERRLRSELTSVEDAWRTLKGELEARNAGVARQALKADSEREDAESLMREAEAALQRFEEAQVKHGKQLAHQLESIRERSADQEAVARNALERLHSELGALASEHGQAQCCVRQAEALNAGLRAQLQALQ